MIVAWDAICWFCKEYLWLDEQARYVLALETLEIGGLRLRINGDCGWLG